MKIFIGIFVGAIITFLSLNYGYSPPAMIQLPVKLNSLPEKIIENSLTNDSTMSIVQREKAIATLIKNDPDYYIKIDNAINNRFTNEAVEKIILRSVRQFKTYTHAFVLAFSEAKDNPIFKILEKKYATNDVKVLQEKMIIENIRKDRLVYMFLKKKFPGYSDTKLARTIFSEENNSELKKSLFVKK